MSELRYGLHAAERLGYIDRETHRALGEEVSLVAGPLHGLITRYRVQGAIVKGAGVIAILAGITHLL